MTDPELKLYAEHLEKLRAIEAERTEKLTAYMAEALAAFAPKEKPAEPDRDWLAGCALSGNIVRTSLQDYELTALFGKHRTGITREEIIAADAYQIADAMLARRRSA